MPTIRDVATAANVSVGTVSRVLSNNNTVKQPLKERVLAAIDALDYKPNLAARALRTNRVDIVGLVVPDITNPFFAQLAKCIEAEAAERGHAVMLANSYDEVETERQQILALLERSPRGIIVVAASGHAIRPFDTDIPILSVDRRLQGYPLVATDHSEGAALMADHLFALNHRRITYIAGPQNTEVGRARKKGFVTRIKQLSHPNDPVELKIINGHFNYESGEKMGRRILMAHQTNRPTAIAAASDQLAIGVLRVAHDLKLDVPRDVSIAGFDDIALALLVAPRLTTIRQPSALLAQTAMRHLFAGTDIPTQTVLPAELMVRESTGRPR